MQIVPLQPTPSQVINVTLAGQTCTIAVYQKSSALYLDLTVGGVLLLAGVICQNLNRIVRDVYIGFIGDLAFLDLQGTTDPVFTGLSGRYVLAYIEATDLAALPNLAGD